MGTMGKYVPFALIILLTAGVIGIEHSILDARGTNEASLMSYGLELFVFALFATAIFVIGAMYQVFTDKGMDIHPFTSHPRGEKSWTSF